MIEESEIVSLYSISFSMDRMTEFERFMEKFEAEASYNKDYQKVLYAVSMILREGALERFFRPEGTMKDGVCHSNRIGFHPIILFENFGRDTSSGQWRYQGYGTYEENSKLLGYVMDLQKFETLLKKDIDEGIVSVEKNILSESKIKSTKYETECPSSSTDGEDFT